MENRNKNNHEIIKRELSGDDADDLLNQLPIGEYYTCTSVLQNVYKLVTNILNVKVHNHN